MFITTACESTVNDFLNAVLYCAPCVELINVGIVIAATTPIIPKVINTSARVKPLNFVIILTFLFYCGLLTASPHTSPYAMRPNNLRTSRFQSENQLCTNISPCALLHHLFHLLTLVNQVNPSGAGILKTICYKHILYPVSDIVKSSKRMRA